MSLAKAEVVLGANDGALRAALGRAQGAMRSAGRRLGRIAARAGQAITAALAAAGTAAVKFAGDFEAEMTKLQTLVGINRDQVRAWGGDLKRVAMETGQPLQQLSQAMFAITSGGLRGSKALETLRQSARAATVGLGSVREIGRTATAALQAFGDQGLTATAAIDQMVATVRAGNLQARDLAGSLGRVMGIASNLGVRFADLNAFVATFTRLGTSAEESVTSLRAILSGLTGANKQAADAFEQLGVPLAEVRREIREKGLVQGLRLMMDAAGGNIEQLTELIPNVRALSGFLGTAGAQSEEFAKIQRQVRNAMGLTNEGFRTARGTLNNMIARLREMGRAALVAVGERMLPAMKDLLDMAMDRLPQLITGLVQMIGRVGVSMVNFTAGMVRFFESTAGKVAGGLGLLGMLFLGPKGGAVVGTISAMGARIGRNLARIRFGPDSEEAVAAQRVLDLVEERNGLIERRASLQRQLRDDPAHAAALRDELSFVNDEMARVNRQLDIANTTLARTPEAATEGLGGLASGARQFFQDLAEMEFTLGLGVEAESSTSDALGKLEGWLLPPKAQAAAAMQKYVDDLLARMPRMQTLFTPQAAQARSILADAEGGGIMGGLLDSPIMGQFNQQMERATQFMSGAGDEAGKSFTDALGDRLKQGAQSAMRALLDGLIRGKDNIGDALVNIGLSLASSLLTGGLFSALGIASPAKEGIFAGQMLVEGLVAGISGSMRRVKRAGQGLGALAASAVQGGPQVSMSATAGGRAAGIHAGGGGRRLDPNDLDELGQLGARLLAESPTLQRVGTVIVDSANRRAGR